MNTSTRHIHFRDDFFIRETFRDSLGNQLPLPLDVDFVLTYHTKHDRSFIASRRGGVYSNCTPDGDALLVIFKNHGLCEGPLRRDLHLSLPNDLMPDGVQNVYYPADLNLLLWHLPSDAAPLVDSSLLAPFTRGPQGIQGLQGEPGRDGRDGRDGVDGSQGLKGDRGDRGEQGIQGIQGERGLQGEKGERGDRGLQGLQGLQGVQGVKGDKGDKGDPFTFADFTPAQLAALKGEKGDTGAKGERGEDGSNNKLELFDDLFMSAATTWAYVNYAITPAYHGQIDHTHMEGGVNKPYCLNGLWFTYNEGRRIFIHSRRVPGLSLESSCGNMALRTTFPLIVSTSDHVLCTRNTFMNDPVIEVVSIVVPVAGGYIRWTDCSQAFIGARNLRKVITNAPLKIWWGDAGAFVYCYKLQEIDLCGQVSFSIKDCPLLTYETVKGFLRSSPNITITVHPDVYAKITDESNTEWHQLLIDATAKNIQFATV